ncbi:9684_t:CDS:2 [Paraglomus occultum]|uniref:9684_t:CDS:1 n=1 Tax=Paraglomus occultum TaxID=144539 RepID=A0A9N9GMJ8_9GLOM|nr:9684_t:CDS:2 [Paraglomus occultum]
MSHNRSSVLSFVPTSRANNFLHTHKTNSAHSTIQVEFKWFETNISYNENFLPHNHKYPRHGEILSLSSDRTLLSSNSDSTKHENSGPWMEFIPTKRINLYKFDLLEHHEARMISTVLEQHDDFENIVMSIDISARARNTTQNGAALERRDVSPSLYYLYRDIS